ncbi:MAG: sigma-54 interaction domain-containing protein [Eubacteriales bacterium]
MSRLLTIQEFIQQTVDAISGVIDFDVVIIDEEISLVAGSGKYKNKIGNNYGQGSITQKIISGNVFSNQEIVFVPTSHYNDTCKDCQSKEECDIFAALLCSIKHESQVIGTISIYAVDDLQRNAIIEDLVKYENFLKKISSLISSKIGEKELHDRAFDMDKKFASVIDTIQEGIIAFDDSATITQCNKSAPRMLGRELQDLIGHKLSNIFSDFPEDATTQRQIAGNLKLTYRNGNNNQNTYSANVIPLDQSSGRRGGVIRFRQITRTPVAPINAVEHHKKLTFADIQGSSKSIIDLKERMKRVANTDSTILLHGESGTGKELFAQTIHFESRRAAGPFIPINCGAIPENLLESELFGYEDGAFTGAKKGGKPGKFELAHGGTVFLDEIGDMPLHLQVKLLRVLQEKKFERVGGISPIWVNVRLIAATNRNLEEMISKGEFREDLFYRLSVIPFTLPPLREREKDIFIMAHYFLEKFNTILGKDIAGFSEQVEELLAKYGWPGNVRELENAVEYAVNIETEEVISIDSFPPRIIEALQKDASTFVSGKKLRDLARDAIIEGLRHHGFNTLGKEKVARALGISRATLYRRIKEFGNDA